MTYSMFDNITHEEAIWAAENICDETKTFRHWSGDWVPCQFAAIRMAIYILESEQTQ